MAAIPLNLSFGVVTPDAAGKDGQREPQFSTPMASHKYTSFQSYRAGADLTKSVDYFGHNYNHSSNKGSGFNLLGQQTPEPTAKILNQLCRGDTVTLGDKSGEMVANQTFEQLKQQIMQINGQQQNGEGGNASGAIKTQDQNQIDEMKPESANTRNQVGGLGGDGRAALKVSQRVEQAESNHQMNHSQIDDVDNILEPADRGENENN
jgi:hypothetical protein